MRSLGTFLGLAVGAHSCLHHGTNCLPLDRGTFVIDQYQLYPENADWDEKDCVVYFGAVFNASVVIYDPYKDKVTDTLEFPGITNSSIEHIGGVAWDPYTDHITILVDSAAPWGTDGADVSGDNLIWKWDKATKQIIWSANITALTQGVYGGFQDVEHDSRGHTYIVGSWPSSIMRIDKDGTNLIAWYPPTTNITTKKGYAGLAAIGDILLTNDGDGQIYRFDMRQDKGVPVSVPLTPNVTFGSDEDAIYLPPKYNGTVLLVSSHAAGIQVLRSKDAKWKSAEHLGVLPNLNGTLYTGSAPVAAVQMGSNSVYLIDDWFADPSVPGTVAGNRTLFPMPDITAQIEELLKK